MMSTIKLQASQQQRQRRSTAGPWRRNVLLLIAAVLILTCSFGRPADAFSQGPVSSARTTATAAIDSSSRNLLTRHPNRRSRSSQLHSNNSKLNGDSATNSDNPIPFIIDRLAEPTNQVYKEISRMCIQAFFNDQEPVDDKSTPFWKEWQLGSLRTLQQGDLRRRRLRYPDTNIMFVARRVVTASTARVQRTPLLLDLVGVENAAWLDKSAEDYCRGDILGFVEVTQRPYGLGDETVGFDDESRVKLRKSGFYDKRPILTNLSVDKTARKSGLGSSLVDVCEQTVIKEWDMKEIILEVEDDNANAQRFYQKRGYKVLFEDPASRRYDVNGLWIKQVPCNRKIMRKSLDFWKVPDQAVVTQVQSSMNQLGTRVLQRLKVFG